MVCLRATPDRVRFRDLEDGGFLVETIELKDHVVSFDLSLGLPADRAPTPIWIKPMSKENYRACEHE